MRIPLGGLIPMELNGCGRRLVINYRLVMLQQEDSADAFQHSLFQLP